MKNNLESESKAHKKEHLGNGESGCMGYDICCIIQSGSGSQTAPLVSPCNFKQNPQSRARPADLMYINLRAGVRGYIIEYVCKRVAPPPSWARRRRRCPTRRARDTHAEWCLWPTCQYCWCHDRIIKHAHYHDTHSQHTYTHEYFIICAHSRPQSAIQCSLLLCL
jgi:hypothetical protein